MIVNQFLGTNAGGQNATGLNGLNLSMTGSVPPGDDDDLQDAMSTGSEDLPVFSDDDDGCVEI